MRSTASSTRTDFLRLWPQNGSVALSDRLRRWLPAKVRERILRLSGGHVWKSSRHVFQARHTSRAAADRVRTHIGGGEHLSSECAGAESLSPLGCRQKCHVNLIKIDLTMKVPGWPQDGHGELRRYRFRPSHRPLFHGTQGKVVRGNQRVLTL